MSPRCWTPESAANAVPAARLVLVALDGCADVESDQQLQTMHPTWRHLCQSTNAAHHCQCSFGTTTHRFCEHWDDYGAAQAMAWELMGTWEVRTSPYHTQTNRQVEQAHQMLMHMLGKLSNKQKVDWPKHLLELVHAYNSMRMAITGYSPHYLMFGCWLSLLIDFYFPIIWDMEKHQCVYYYIAELCEWLWETFEELQEQSTAVAKR